MSFCSLSTFISSVFSTSFPTRTSLSFALKNRIPGLVLSQGSKYMGESDIIYLTRQLFDVPPFSGSVGDAGMLARGVFQIPVSKMQAGRVLSNRIIPCDD
jgi:hypothetical protein